MLWLYYEMSQNFINLHLLIKHSYLPRQTMHESIKNENKDNPTWTLRILNQLLQLTLNMRCGSVTRVFLIRSIFQTYTKLLKTTIWKLRRYMEKTQLIEKSKRADVFPNSRDVSCNTCRLFTRTLHNFKWLRFGDFRSDFLWDYDRNHRLILLGRKSKIKTICLPTLP